GAINRALVQRPLALAADRGRRVPQRFLLTAYGLRALGAGHMEEAFAYFRKTLQTRTPFYASTWYEDCLADAYLATGRLNDAIIEYRRVLARYPRLALVWYHLGQA